MEFLSQTYVALRGPTGAPQSAEDAIEKLANRLIPSTLLADRRASVQALKGLVRDWRKDVGDHALKGLLYVAVNDAQVDEEIGKAVLETLNILCDVDLDEHKETGYLYTDVVLSDENTVQALFSLLGDTAFYTRFATLHFLGTLLKNRRQVVQGHFLKVQSGPSAIISVLEDKREIIRNEAITVVQSLTSQSPDIQKILAFEGAFEKLFNIVTSEGGIDGGVVVFEAMSTVETLLRFNTPNQSYFRETQLPPLLCHLLQYPATLALSEPTPQQFALQFWDDQKGVNAGVVVGILGMLVGSKASSAQESSNFSRCLVEIALASNFPETVKTQALRLLPASFTFPLSELTVTPYVPVPDTNGEEWDRLEPASALDVLVELALHGEYNGVLAGNKRTRDNLELRAVAVSVFENFVRKDEVRNAILQAMIPTEGVSDPPPITPLLYALLAPPSANILDFTSTTSTHIAAFLFSHLLRGSHQAKALARQIKPGPLSPPGDQAAGGGNFFVPADGGAPPPEPDVPEEDDEPPQAVLQILSENLSLALLSRSRADKSDKEAREWDRLVVIYLSLLSQWLWEDPASVRDFLDAGGLGVLVEPINQTSELDTVVPGLCALLLGICYEFNREPGEIARHSIYPILNRLGVDTLIGRTTRLREDERFKAVGPDSCVLPYPTPAHLQPGIKPDGPNDAEMWFDWAFIDFWKSNYHLVQRGFSTEPDASSTSNSSAVQSAESAALIVSLRESLRKQNEEIAGLKSQLVEHAKEKAAAPTPAATSGADETASLKRELELLKVELTASTEKQKEMEKEQEDLLVLLDEVNAKRKADKVKMRGAGMDVSEDEEEDEEEDDEE
ncbi:p115 like vesicle tethering protein [Flagelloscypha sp. PMI_526]|nr:p115 like vesicle tethering protein [Flagelloscypha sp. PMI_526]